MDCNLKHIPGACKSNTLYISRKVNLKKEMLFNIKKSIICPLLYIIRLSVLQLKYVSEIKRIQSL